MLSIGIDFRKLRSVSCFLERQTAEERVLLGGVAVMAAGVGWPGNCLGLKCGAIELAVYHNAGSLAGACLKEIRRDDMKKPLSRVMMTRLRGGGAVILAVAGLLGAQSAMAGISATKHNLGSGGSGSNAFSGTTEICVFCHTPHGADSTAAVPLWNKKMSNASAYTTYNSLGTSSLDGATVAVGSVSLACLSCHDGTQAMNVMINQPGSGGYNSAGVAFGSVSKGEGTLSDGKITKIGTDLTNDHPIGIQYAGGPKSGSVPAAPGAYGSSLFNDADFKEATSAVINSKSVWWVDTGTNGNGRQKTDMLLYTRKNENPLGGGSSLTGDQPFVECASCHDPHSENTTFLRIPNDTSAVCLACHIK